MCTFPLCRGIPTDTDACKQHKQMLNTYTFTETLTHECARTHTSSGLQWVIKQLTFDKWMKTVVVSAGPGPSLCAAEGLKLKTAKLKILWMTSAPIHIAPAWENKCTSTCRSTQPHPTEKNISVFFASPAWRGGHLCSFVFVIISETSGTSLSHTVLFTTLLLPFRTFC